MKKNLFLISSLFVLTCIGLGSCESKGELESMDIDSIISERGNLVAEDLANYIVPDLRLINEEGKATTVFSYGENIKFELTFRNISDHTIRFAETDVLGNDLFRVFTKDGMDLGCPWDYTMSKALYPAVPITIAAGESASWSCKWKGLLLDDSNGLINSDNPNTSVSETELISKTILFVQTKERTNLPKGDYYCQFDIALGDNVKTCWQDFTVE